MSQLVAYENISHCSTGQVSSQFIFPISTVAVFNTTTSYSAPMNLASLLCSATTSWWLNVIMIKTQVIWNC